VTAKPEQPHYGINEYIYGLEENIDFDIYSCYPYEDGRCGDNLQAVLVDQCYDENSGELSHNTNLFPNKIPNNFAGCVVTVWGSFGAPYIMGVHEGTDLFKNATITFTGLEIEYLLHITEVLDVTVQFVTNLRQFLSSGNVHKIVLIVHNPILSHALDASIPYIYDSLK
jgi:hypothetical protein